ncbi:MAG: hypothetical protein QOI78_7497 [Actinomycetota bacterium]|jgi:hypothetical protein|nr:hypothetical protein [Actinomycetota bacterium]
MSDVDGWGEDCVPHDGSHSQDTVIAAAIAIRELTRYVSMPPAPAHLGMGGDRVARH